MAISPSNTRNGSALRRLAAATVAGTLAILVTASAASAHVKVSGDVPSGGSGVITFRAPSESTTASTTELTVSFPTDTPVKSADTQPMPGWTSKVTTKKLSKPVKTEDGEIDTYVAQIDWKADSASDGVPPGQFQLFNVSVSGLPKASQLAFPALQRYSDGSTVNWNEASSGSAEPEHPAPVLTLGAATPAAPSSGPTVSSAAGPAASGTDTPHPAGPGWTGTAGLIAGILGLIAGIIAVARSGSRRTAER